MHGRDDVVERLPGGLNPGLDSGRKVDVGEAAGRLELTDGAGSCCAERRALP